MNCSEWMNKQIQAGYSMTAIKRDPYPGETYDDGTPLKNQVNAGWRCDQTGEEFWFDDAMREGE